MFNEGVDDLGGALSEVLTLTRVSRYIIQLKRRPMRPICPLKPARVSAPDQSPSPSLRYPASPRITELKARLISALALC
jgi:hypothetical protein